MDTWLNDDGYDIHYDCNGVVYHFKEGSICNNCGESEDREMTDPNVEERLAALPDVEGTITGIISAQPDVVSDPLINIVLELQYSYGSDYVYAPSDALTALVGQYVSHIETAESKEVCKCTWMETRGFFKRVDTALDCPVHTKEGFLLGFFTWLLTFPSDRLNKLRNQIEQEVQEAHDEAVSEAASLSDTLKQRVAQSDFRYVGD